jgi:charged multivesicular body protein 1
MKSSSDQLFDMIFEFKFISKQMQKESVKAEKEEKKTILKVKEAIEKGLPDSAKIYAADAIRRRNEAKRYQVLSSKLDAIHSRLKTAYQTQTVSRAVNLRFLRK